MLVEALAQTVDDPLLREATDLQGLEEAHHAPHLSLWPATSG